MRSFDERKAEIFRRSRERIRARKRLTRIAVTCSLAIFVVAGSLTMLWSIGSKPDSDEYINEGTPNTALGVTAGTGTSSKRGGTAGTGTSSKRGGTAGSKSSSKLAGTTRSKASSKLAGNAGTKASSNFIEIRTEGEGGVVTLTDPQTLNTVKTLLEAITTPVDFDDAETTVRDEKTYFITLSDGDAVREFTLYKSTLTDLASEAVYALTPEQLTELKTALQLD